jgi:AcrR family transcriptional regulator
MPSVALDPKQRLLNAAIGLLAETPNPEALTVRQIARRAKVGTGLLNYHYGCKENLMDEAVAELMRRNAGLEALETTSGTGGTPADRVREILKQTSRIGLRFPTLTPLVVRRALLNGGYGPERTLLPLLREHFGGRLSEPEIRVTAIQIVAPLQALAARPKDAEVFTGLSLNEESAVDRAIDRLVDNILK